ADPADLPLLRRRLRKRLINDLCKRGKLGLVKTVPDGMKPGSDVANLSMMGYAPDKYYTGRSPLEALSIGIDLKDSDVAIRCNLVTLSDEENYADKTMLDYSAGEISTEEARQLIEYLQQNLGDEYIDFYTGVSYRHCLVAHNAETGTDFTPPHDISDKKITQYLPKGEYGDIFLDIMTDSYNLLKDHPVNKKRIERGLKPANSIWLWGEGTRPQLTPFEEKYGIKGAVISAVDLIKGIGTGAQMKVINVEGATGTYKTNFKGKAEAAIDALKEGYDYVYIHMEAPDECGHQGDVDNKVKSIELIDSIVVKYVKEQLDLMNEDYKILIAPDHPTPLSLKTHTSDPVPFIIYAHKSGEEQSLAIDTPYSEANAKDAGLFFSTGEELMEEFLHGEIPSQSTEDADAEESAKASDKDESSDKKENKKKEDKKEKQDKPAGQKKKLGKKGIIAIVASVCLVGVLLAIILPIV
ncbi:MAG: cofactor-independent phosphoglycerate mutase, partial [Clostridia bacterium]|nr:cofactor-independent phosphoglycerate mutase [Clostridia bacterium]